MNDILSLYAEKKGNIFPKTSDKMFSHNKGLVDEQAAELWLIMLNGLEDVVVYCLTYI